MLVNPYYRHESKTNILHRDRYKQTFMLGVSSIIVIIARAYINLASLIEGAPELPKIGKP